jgi:phosphatidylglycerophosphate synthase
MSRIAEAIDELRSAQKSSRGAPAYSRFVNRPLGRLLAATAHTAGLTPNTVTMLSGATTFTGIAVIALVPPALLTSAVITLLLVLGYALDSADGQVARLQGRSSLDGEWLDHMADALKMGSIHLAVAVAWYRWFDLDAIWLLVPLAFQVTSTVFFFGVILTDMLRRVAGSGAAPATGGDSRTSWWYSLAVIPADYGLLCLVFLTMWIQPVFVTIYTTLTAINALLLLASLLRWFRAVKALR